MDSIMSHLCERFSSFKLLKYYLNIKSAQSIETSSFLRKRFCPAGDTTSRHVTRIHGNK